jgi:hypothetical protein
LTLSGLRVIHLIPFRFQRSLRKQLAEPVEIGLGKPREDMWDDLLSVFKKMLETSEELYRAKAKSKLE